MAYIPPPRNAWLDQIKAQGEIHDIERDAGVTAYQEGVTPQQYRSFQLRATLKTLAMLAGS